MTVHVTSDLRSQRDRYIAFSLAAADLLIEARLDGVIQHVTGATQTLLGASAEALLGRPVTELFATLDRLVVAQLLDRAQRAGRIEPVALNLPSPGAKPAPVAFGACFLPGRSVLYLTLSVLPASLAPTMPERDGTTGLLNAEDFQAMANCAVRPGDSGAGADMLRNMRLIGLRGLSAAMEGLSQARSTQLLSEIGTLLRCEAASPDMAGRIGADEFAILSRNGDIDDKALKQGLSATLAAAGVKSSAVQPNITTIRLVTGNLDENSVAKALEYVMKNFPAAQQTGEPRSLEDMVASEMKDTLATRENIRATIAANDFQLHYQPVVDLTSRQVHHYEALLRFVDNPAPYETIRFSEQLGLIIDVDLAVCRRAITALAERDDISIAVNVSGASIQNPRFCSDLSVLLKNHKNLAGRLLFELTESSHIEEIEPAARFLNSLRGHGFSLCLDDFGSGATAYNYLRRFDADYIKIDGPFLRTALSSKRERALIRSIAVLAKELGCQVIGEMIETEQLAGMAQQLGITLGQGYLFGRPEANFKPVAAAMPRLRRKGETESWG